MNRRPTRNSSGTHRLVYIQDLDHIPAGDALWQEPSTFLSPLQQQLISALRQAIITRLTERQRVVIQLFFFEGLSQGEIARRLGVTQQVIHKRIHGDHRNGRMVGGALARLHKALSPLLEPSDRAVSEDADRPINTSRPMKNNRTDRLRHLLAQEAARLMYEEDIKQYYTAKRVAARRLLGAQGGRKMRYRPRDLPSNGEIQAALLDLSRLMDGDMHDHRLFAMRIVALETMQELLPFHPRLIGSVSTGHVHRGSDIDIHVFVDDIDQLFAHLRYKDLGYEKGTDQESRKILTS